VVKHRQLARQVGASPTIIGRIRWPPLDNNVEPAKGTTFYVGSWVFVADGSGGFDSHLIDPSAPETSEAARHQEVDGFIDQLDEIPLPVHVKEARNRPDFDVTTPKTLSEL